MAALPVAPEQMTEQTPWQMLSAEAVKACEGMLASALKDNQISRRDEVRRTWKLRDYCRGRQHNVYDKRSYLYITPEASGEELPLHMGTYDITSPHKRSFVSILSENPPGVHPEPNDLQEGNDVSSSKQAEKARIRIDRVCSMRERQEKVSGYLCTDGRVISWTHIDQRGKLIVDLFGVLESKVPVFAQSKEDWGYCVLSREVDQWRAKWEWPDYASKINASDSGSSESQYERYARLAIISSSRGGNADALKGLTTEHYAFIAPWRYLKVQDAVRKELDAAFPDGIVIHAFGSVAVDGQPADWDELAVEFPVDGEGQARPALLSGCTDIQDAYNDIKNMLRETAEYGIPATWVDTSGGGVDLEAIAEQKSEPGAIHGISLAAGKTMEQSVKQEEPALISPQIVAMLPDLITDSDRVSGDTPSLRGEEISGQDTVGVNKMLTNQAMGQLGPGAACIRRLWTKIYPVAIRLYAQLHPEPFAVMTDKGRATVDPQTLLDGNSSWHLDEDPSHPETTADKRSSLQAVLSQLGDAPQGAAIIFQPDNLKLIKQYSGLTDLIIPGAEARDKQLSEIEQMLHQTPVPPSQEAMAEWQTQVSIAQQSGQPAPPQPQPTSSVDVDEDWDYHQPEADKVQEWLSSDARLEAERGGLQSGIQNIKLHGQAHRAALAKQAASNAPQPEPPKIALTGQITDPNSISQLLGQKGIQTPPEAIEEANAPETAKVVAQGQHAASQAQHVAVLAAKESVEPAGGFAHNKPSPKPPLVGGGK